MPFSEEERERIDTWFEQKDVRGDCPACRQQVTWSILDEMVLTPAVRRDAGDPGINLNLKRGGAFITRACMTCGYTMFFDAVALGFAEREESAGQVET